MKYEYTVLYVFYCFLNSTNICYPHEAESTSQPTFEQFCNSENFDLKEKIAKSNHPLLHFDKLVVILIRANLESESHSIKDFAAFQSDRILLMIIKTKIRIIIFLEYILVFETNKVK